MEVTHIRQAPPDNRNWKKKQRERVENCRITGAVENDIGFEIIRTKCLISRFCPHWRWLSRHFRIRFNLIISQFELARALATRTRTHSRRGKTTSQKYRNGNGILNALCGYWAAHRISKIANIIKFTHLADERSIPRSGIYLKFFRVFGRCKTQLQRHWTPRCCLRIAFVLLLFRSTIFVLFHSLKNSFRIFLSFSLSSLVMFPKTNYINAYNNNNSIKRRIIVPRTRHCIAVCWIGSERNIWPDRR